MITLGEHTYCANVKGIDCYEKTLLTFGKFCAIGSGLKIMSGQHPPVEHPECITQFPLYDQFGFDYYPSKMDGKVVVGNDVWIATDVTILDGVTIGDGAILGAKSVIGSDVPPYTIAIGNPWRVLRKRFDDLTIEALLKIKWWDWPMDKIRAAAPYMKTLDKFMEKYGQS